MNNNRTETVYCSTMGACYVIMMLVSLVSYQMFDVGAKIVYIVVSASLNSKWDYIKMI